MQALLIKLISDFEFTLPADGNRVYRAPSPVVTPAVHGENGFESMLPLNVTVVGD